MQEIVDYHVRVCFYCLLVILSIMLTAVKMLPNNHKIAHNVVQTTILFTFYPLQPHAYCQWTIKKLDVHVVFTNTQYVISSHL